MWQPCLKEVLPINFPVVFARGEEKTQPTNPLSLFFIIQAKDCPTNIGIATNPPRSGTHSIFFFFLGGGEVAVLHVWYYN